MKENEIYFMLLKAKTLPYLKPAVCESEYESQVKMLDMLIDEVGEDEQHSLAETMEKLGALIYDYETKHYPIEEEK